MKKYCFGFFIALYINGLIHRSIGFNILRYVIILCLIFGLTSVVIKLFKDKLNDIFDKQYYLIKITAIIFSTIILVAIPQIATYPYEKTDVYIESSEDINKESKGNEVWILEIKYGNKKINLDEMSIPDGWIYKEGALIATDINKPLHIEIPKAKEINIRFMKHAWSGSVEVKTENEQQKIDLYESSYGEYVHKVKPSVHIQNKFITILEWISAFIFVVSLSTMGLILIKKKPYKMFISIWAGVFAFISTPYIYLSVGILTLILVILLTYNLFADKIINFLRKNVRYQRTLFYSIAGIGALISTLMTTPDLTQNFMGILAQANVIDIPNLFIFIMIIGIIGGVQLVLWLIICTVIRESIDKDSIKLDKFEKKLLIIAVAIFSIISIVVNLKTTAFIYPLYENAEGNLNWGFVLGTDSIPNIYNGLGNSFVSNNASDNELRHLLLGSICAPFSFVAYIMAFVIRLIFIVFNLNINFQYIFGYCFSLVQIGFFMISSLLIYRLLKQTIRPIYAKLFILLYLISFPVLYYALTIEAYAVGLITLLIFITLCINKRSDKVKKLGYIGTTGTLLSSAVTLPFILIGKRWNIKNVISEFIKYGFSMFYAVLLFGQFYEITNIVESLKLILSFTSTGEKSSILDNIYKFLVSVANFILVPQGFFDAETYQILYTSPNVILMILGGIILIIAIVGFWLNRKEKIAQICMYWIAFTIFLEVIMGWGAKLNEMSLYASYFSWAFLILIAMAFNKVVKNTKIGIYIMSLLLGIVFLYNLDKWIELINLCIDKFNIFWPSI